MATSMLPLPSPSNTAATMATGNVVANAKVSAEAMSIASPTSETCRAPIESDSRPPTCIATIAASAAANSMTEMWPASMSSRSRIEGSAPP